MKAGLDGKGRLVKGRFYAKAVELRRSGPESDRFLRALTRNYGLKRTRARMAEVVQFTAFPLHQGKLDLERQPVKLKLFGHDAANDVPGRYCESFFNVDLNSGLVFWNEKDPEYRQALTAALADG